MKKTGRGIIALAILAAWTTSGRALGMVTTNQSGSVPRAVANLAASSNLAAPLVAADGLPSSEIKPKYSLRSVVDGLVQREIWTNIPTPPNFLAQLFTDPRYPSQPSLLDYIPTPFGSYSTNPPYDQFDSYGMRYAGHVIPSVSGDYLFQVHADDSSRFRLSTDAQASNAVELVLRDGTCCAYDVSPVVHLEARQPYYFDAVMQEGVGWDYLEITWQPPGSSDFSPIPSTNLAYISDVSPGPAPSSLTVSNHCPATFTVSPVAYGAAQAEGKVRFQWERSDDGGATWSAIPAANGPSYTMAQTKTTDSGAQFHAIISVAGVSVSFTSDPATLTVVARPYSLGLSVPDRRELYVYFSTNMEAVTALEASRYHINHGMKVASAQFARGLGTNGPQSVVRLSVEPLLGFFPDYSLSISNVFDAGRVLAIAPNPTTLPFHLDYRALGYLYLSPLPGAEYVSDQTRFVLVRFKNVSPSDVANLATFITVAGSSSGIHNGQTHVASDGRTVIFTMNQDFSLNEEVTVSLAPQSAAGSGLDSYQYQFVVTDHLPDLPVISARGDNPPSQAKENILDGDPATTWLDSIVPDGSANFSWLQYLYPPSGARVVSQYALTSAGDAPEGDPKDWRFYGMDGVGELVLLDTQTNQTFSSRCQRKVYAINNGIAYQGYRLEITRVNDPATAVGVQLAELELIERQGSILHEYWMNVPGAAVSDLTNNANYPANPTVSDELSTFEVPSLGADNYGTRVRGYVTAPITGTFFFWIASDDNGELWLSTDDQPANKSLIASVPGWTNCREWNKYAQQRSSGISLTGGQTYYIEALQKQDIGGENLAVGWAKPGQATSAPSEIIPGTVLSPWTNGSSAPAQLFQTKRALADGPLMNTPLKRGVGDSGKIANRFDGLHQTGKTVETVSRPPQPQNTPLKRGVNESQAHAIGRPYEISGLAAAASPKGANQPAAGLTSKSVVMLNGVSVPSDFPQVVITARGNPSADYIWLENSGQGGQTYKMILDNQGNPIFYQRGGAWDFKPQKNGLITWASFVGVDKNFNYVRSYSAVNGYGTDMHELQVMEDGSYFLIGDGSSLAVDMSRFVSNGNPSAWVLENVVQQFTAEGDLIFQWRAWDHLDVASQQPFVDLTSDNFDFPHMNAIDVDEDGHILVSNRSSSECTKINRDTGEVIWRLGGTQSTLTFVNDPLNGPSGQHSIRSIGHGHYLLFDNGNLHDPPISRAVEYAVDPVAKTATLVWQFRDTPDKYTLYMGNVQRLTNGNTHINWVLAEYPKAVEVDSNGVKQLELNLTPGWDLYRSWRAPWDGVMPVPYLIVESYPDNVTLIFNKFGDHRVDHYRIYGGTTPAPTTLLAVSKTTLVQLANLANGVVNYFRVTAVSTDGTESDYSNEENVMVNILQPGDNMIQNADFSTGTNSWIWSVAHTGAGTFSVAGGACLIHITSAGTALTDLQLRQSGLKLLQGKPYVLEFDGSAVGGNHPLDVKLGQDQSPFGIYGTASPTLRTPRQHFRYVFAMTNATDLDARLMFNMGGVARDVVLDNVTLSMAYDSQVPVTLDTLPGGRQVTVDAASCTTPVTFTWATNSMHTISTASPQLSGDGHARYTFSSWSDGGGQTHAITVPLLGANYTAGFSAKYLLDITNSPSGGGLVTAAPPGPWFDAGQLVSLTAQTNTGYKFLSWTGVDSQSNNTAQVNLNSSRSVSANFGRILPVISLRSISWLPGGGIQFDVRDSAGVATQVMVWGADAPSLSNWQTLGTVTLTAGNGTFTDTNAPSFPLRFYRVTAP